jgi:hypothetical protein
MQDIQPRHWHELAKRHGMAPTGADSPYEQVIEQTPAVIAKVLELLPQGFPVHISHSILEGLRGAAKRYAQSP